MGGVVIPEGIVVRHFEVSDVPEVRKFVSGCPPLEAHTEFTYWVLASYFSNLCFIAETVDGIAGFVSAVSNRGRCYLWQIGVAPPHRGGPLGKALIAAVVNEAATSGCKCLQFSIDPENRPSTGLFSRFAGHRGFEMRHAGKVGCEIVYEWIFDREGISAADVSFSGYFPGALGMILEAHGSYYHEAWGFDSSFETQEGRELSEFFTRYTEGRDYLRVALAGGDFAGSIAVDGSCEGPDGARLRWFIVKPGFQGQGIGNALMNDAMTFCRVAGHRKVHLWTFEGLDAARHLYEKAGFLLTKERPVRQWGRGRVNEQKFCF
ncbi:MAG TPA: GNAT family N-acetyltransferase [Desulfobacteraceae bacterium]|nr:GNAT family N-acetyltransferase [Desulfobacteraceae bacterium]